MPDDIAFHRFFVNGVMAIPSGNEIVAPVALKAGWTPISVIACGVDGSRTDLVLDVFNDSALGALPPDTPQDLEVQPANTFLCWIQGFVLTRDRVVNGIIEDPTGTCDETKCDTSDNGPWRNWGVSSPWANADDSKDQFPGWYRKDGHWMWDTCWDGVGNGGSQTSTVGSAAVALLGGPVYSPGPTCETFDGYTFKIRFPITLQVINKKCNSTLDTLLFSPANASYVSVSLNCTREECAWVESAFYSQTSSQFSRIRAKIGLGAYGFLQGHDPGPCAGAQNAGPDVVCRGSSH